MKAVKKDVFDINKVTVVGSPTITSDGVASGFSGGNSVDIPLSIASTKFTIEGEFTFGSNLTTFQFCCDVFSPAINRYIISIRPISDNDLAVCYWNGTGTEVVFYSQTEVPRIANKSYKYKIEIDGTTAKSTINGITKTINNFVFSDVTKIMLGSNSVGYGLFYGSIDLNSFKIYVDGELVYSPTRPTTFLERRKEGFDLSKFTVVGSPTITSDGVASGFSGGNYLTIPFNNSGLVEVNAVFSYGEATSAYSIPFLFFTDNETLTRLNPVIVKSSSFLTIDFGAGGIKLEKNRDYNIKFITDCQTFVKMLVDDEQVSTRTLTVGEKVNLIGCNIGRGHESLYPFAGSIDLKQFSVTVDGKEVFTGAKEKFYAIRDF